MTHGPFISPVTELPIERVGFTGTREGLTDPQATALATLLKAMWPFKELHHGVCVGADEQAHLTVRELFGRHVFKGAGREIFPGPQIHGWPPTVTKFLSEKALHDLDVAHPAKDFKARDREIVWRCQGLIACPRTPHELHRSGTWYTVRQAAACLRPIYLIRPDGQVVSEWKTEMGPRIQDSEYEELVRHVVGRGQMSDKDYEGYVGRLVSNRAKADAELRERLDSTDGLNTMLALAGLPTVELDVTLGDDIFDIRPANPEEDLSDVFG